MRRQYHALVLAIAHSMDNPIHGLLYRKAWSGSHSVRWTIHPTPV